MRFLAAVFVLSASASTGLCQVPTSRGMSGQRRAEEANRGMHPTFPSGDTAAVYRAALDLLYIDGNDKASVAVIYEFVGLPRAGGPCPRCRRIAPWVHQSAIDTSTIEAFGDLVLPPGLPLGGIERDRHFYLPNFRQFGYTIPLVFLSADQQEEMSRAGAAYDSAHPPPPDGSGEDPFFGELARRYPGVWGSAGFSAVAFNRAHTEALLGIRQNCGTFCRSYEVVFFRKLRGRWTPIERVPSDVEAMWAAGTMRYRGPLATGQSQLLVDKTGASLPVRPDARDVPRVYRAVLDSLYSFFGERPRLVVISAQHARAARITATQIPQVDSSTLAAHNFVSQIGDQLRFQSSFGRGTRILTAERIRQLAVEGTPPGIVRVARYDAGLTGFWHTFRKHYPGAWGYAAVSRVAFNHAHTQALVYTTHHCGTSCQNSATWFLTRTGETWSIAQRITQQEESHWALDSLRYLGTGANLQMYRRRIVRGVFSNAANGKPMPNLEVTVGENDRLTRKIRTDEQGRYSLPDLPLNTTLWLNVDCPVPGRTDMMSGAFFGVRPGLDTTINVALDYRKCRRLNREHPLIAAGAKPSRTVFHPVTAEAAAVYRAILDAIYPPDSPVKGPILMEAFSENWCRGCFGIEAEVPRLIRQGVLDPSTERSFVQALRDTVSVPDFSYRRKIRLVPREDHWLRGERGGYNWDLMKDAYPGTDAVISFSGVGFNSSGREALVEVRVDSVNKEGGETLLLRKTGGEWRVAARHLDRGHTSGEWSGGKCEPTDAPAQPADLERVKKISGEFNITWIGTSRAIRGHTKKLRVVIEPAKPNPKYGGAVVGNVRVLRPTGEPDTSIVGEFWFSENVGELIFPDQSSVRADSHLSSDNYYILRTDGTSFFGGWWYGNEEDDVNHPRGYFCASPKVRG